MLRRLPSAEVPAGSAPTVRSLLVPEAASVTRTLEVTRARAASLRTLRRELAEYLTAALPRQARELALPAPQLQAWIEHEMGRFAGAHRLCVRVHPDDAAQLETADLIAARVGLAGTIEIVQDLELTPGGCVIESERGALDGRVETRVGTLIALMCRLESP